VTGMLGFFVSTFEHDTILDHARDASDSIDPIQAASLTQDKPISADRVNPCVDVENARNGTLAGLKASSTHGSTSENMPPNGSTVRL
jgi:hypothetical protein